MRKRLKLSLPLSLLFLGIGTLCVSSALPSSAIAQQLTIASKFLHILGIPAPREMVSVVEGSPFLVPPGKIFVVTGASVQRYGSLQMWPIEIRFNGQMALCPSIDPYQGGVVQIPPGLTATAGTTVTTLESGGADPLTVSVVLGYLSDA